MMKRLIYLSILIMWSCDALVEESTPLDGEFYIQDGWMAFLSKEYIEADRFFSTAIENNEERSLYHFLSSIGRGWAYMYNAKTKYDSVLVAENLVQLSGEAFDIALSIINDLDNNSYYVKDEMNLYAGLTIQRALHAKQKSANQANWETLNSELYNEIITASLPPPVMRQSLPPKKTNYK